MSDDKEWLQSWYVKHPGLKPVDEALDAYFSGRPITSRCIVCDELLNVFHTELPDGWTSTTVSCPNGCTGVHIKGHKTNPEKGE